MSNPDFIYDPDNWESTFQWEDRYCLIDELSLWYKDIKRFETLVRGPDKFVANIVLSWDDTGDPDETEIQWFDTKEEAEKVVADSLKGRELNGD